MCVSFHITQARDISECLAQPHRSARAVHAHMTPICRLHGTQFKYLRERRPERNTHVAHACRGGSGADRRGAGPHARCRQVLRRQRHFPRQNNWLRNITLGSTAKIYTYASQAPNCSGFNSSSLSSQSGCDAGIVFCQHSRHVQRIFPWRGRGGEGGVNNGGTIQGGITTRGAYRGIGRAAQHIEN